MALKDIYWKHPELRVAYHHTFICYDYPQSVMVPLNHYKLDDAKLYVTIHVWYKWKRCYCNTNLFRDGRLHNIYAVPKEVYDWVYEHFPASNYWHTYSIGIKNTVTTDFEGSLAADFRTDDFSLVVTRGNKLLLTQTFPYSTPADVIYYLLDTCRQFSFSAGNCPCCICRA